MKDYICNLCKKRFGIREKVREHLRIDHNKKGSKGKEAKNKKRPSLAELYTTQESN
jgi:hypothetical protein